MFGAIGGPISSSVAGKISSSNLPSVTNFNFNSIQGIIGYLGYYITVLTRRNEKKAKRR